MTFRPEDKKILLEIARQIFNGDLSAERAKGILHGTDWGRGNNVANPGPNYGTGFPTRTSGTGYDTTTNYPLNSTPSTASTSGGILFNRETISRIIYDQFGYVPQEIKTRPEPFTAWKLAFVEDAYTPLFKANYHYQSYGPIDVATCTYRSHPDDSIPSSSCRCGFYGYKPLYAPQLFLDYNVDPTTVLLEVEFYGKVIEHEFGYRAEKQRVISIWVDVHSTMVKAKGVFTSSNPIFSRYVTDVFDPEITTVKYFNYLELLQDTFHTEVHTYDSIQNIPFQGTYPFNGSVE